MQHGTQTPADVKYDVRPRPDVWLALRKQTSLTSDASLAERLGVNRTTVYRVMSCGTTPSTDFIAHALAAFPFTTFERLFEWYAK